MRRSARARSLGKRVYGEPLIQHLVLDESEYYNQDWKHAARRVMSPPFRDKVHQDDLWNGLRAGSLQVVATDHCAFTTKQKELGLGDFTKIPNGTGGLEDRMPVLWTYGVENRAPHPERIRRRDLDQYRAHPQPLSAQGRDPAGRGRGRRRSGIRRPTRPSRPRRRCPRSTTTCSKESRSRPAALHAVARRGRLPTAVRCRPSSGAAVRRARAVPRGRARAQPNGRSSLRSAGVAR